MLQYVFDGLSFDGVFLNSDSDNGIQFKDGYPMTIGTFELTPEEPSGETIEQDVAFVS